MTETGSTPGARFAAAAAEVGPPDQAAATAALERHDRLTKPRGALGRLEAAGVRLAAISGECPPPVPEPVAVAVFAADHGVVAEGVTPWPQEVTAQMVANFCAGGAAVNVLARHIGAEVLVVDVGVAADLGAAPRLLDRKVRRATGNIVTEQAMTSTEAFLALDVGVEVAEGCVGDGARCLVTGDMGIGNTTPAAAIIAAFTGRPAPSVTGRGSGADDDTLSHKVSAVEMALWRNRRLDDPVAKLAALGGLELASLAGFVIGGAARRVPVVIDGVIAAAALLVAVELVPECLSYCFAGHRSTEPGAGIVLDHLRLEPLLDLGMRLGEGSGAVLAVPLLQAAAKVLRDMATFDDAGISS